MTIYRIIYSVILIKISSAVIKESQDWEQYLVSTITDSSSYNNRVRPSETVTGSFILSLRQIVSIDERNQILTTNSYFSQVWNDSRLQWDPDNFFNITELNLPLKQLWYPDFCIINSADNNAFFKLESNQLATVNYKGEVFSVLSAIGLKTRCKINIQKFPFDTQVCQIAIGSWSQSIDRLYFSADENSIDLSSYLPNSVWSISKLNVFQRNSSDRAPRGAKFYVEDVIFELNLKRGPLYFMINSIFLCLVLNFVTLLSFGLPFIPQVGLCMSTFLTFSMNSIRLYDSVPIQSEYLPMITLYFLSGILFTLISLIWFICKYVFITKNYVPASLLKFSNVCKVMFCVKRDRTLKISVSPPPKQPKKVIKSDEEKEIDQTENPVEGTSDKIDEPRICMKCMTCDLCLETKKKDDENKGIKSRNEIAISALDRFFLFMVSSLMISVNIGIWSFLSSPKQPKHKSYIFI